MKNKVFIASKVNIIVNLFLFIIKIIIGFMFGALSLIADAINSLSDILSALGIDYTIKINNKEADYNHPFGHTRAENIAGYTTGIIMFFLGFTILKMAFEKFLSKEIITYNILIIVVIFITIISKIGLFIYIKNILKKNSSPALKANLADHINDVYIMIGILISTILVKYGFFIADIIMTLIISGIIFKTAFNICQENIHSLMGKRADKTIEEDILKKILSFSEVEKVNLIKTQYLGNKIQVEAHIVLNENISLKIAHDIGHMVEKKISKSNLIESCFIHLDVDKK